MEAEKPKIERDNNEVQKKPRKKWLRRLNERHREIIERYFMGEMVRKIARDMETSKTYVWWILQNPLAKAYLEKLEDRRIQSFIDTQAIVTLMEAGQLDGVLNAIKTTDNASQTHQDKLLRLIKNAQGKGDGSG